MSVGFPLVMVFRVICKAVLKPTIYMLCYWLGIPAYSYSDYKSRVVQLSKHYTTGYKIPPIFVSDTHTN